MEPTKKITYISNNGIIPETDSLTHKSLIVNSSPVVDQQNKTKKAIVHAMKTSKLANRVDDIKTFEQMLADDFDVVVRETFRGQGHSDELHDYLMSLLNRRFNYWFARHFRHCEPYIGFLPDTEFKIHFYKSFKKEFLNNFPIFLDRFFDQHLGMTPYVAYENLISEALEDTYAQIYAQIDLTYTLKHKEFEKEKKEMDKNINIFLN